MLMQPSKRNKRVPKEDDNRMVVLRKSASVDVTNLNLLLANSIQDDAFLLEEHLQQLKNY
jgi:hypothetical protein